MEIASKRTGETDVEAKPARYAALGIPEYWRFDETSEFNGTMLAGDQPVDGQYEPVAIKEVEVGVLQGYSARAERLDSVGTRGAPLARPGDGAGNTHLQAGVGS